MVESAVQSAAEIVVGSDEKKLIRVLHVDDELDLLKVAKQCLELQGPFQVDTAGSVEEALAKLEKEQYAAVISDYQMPEKDGLFLLKELRSSRNEIPFIMFTGRGREEVAIQALNLGADQYIDKTGDPATVYCELAHAIRKTVERKRAQEEKIATQMALKTCGEEYGRLFDSAIEGILINGSDGRISSLNPAAAKILGYNSPKELVGTSTVKLYADPDDRARILRELKKNGYVKDHAMTWKKKDGALIEIMASVTAQKDEKGNLVRTEGIIRDVTERKRSEELLRESEERFRGLFEGIQDPVGIFVGREGRLLDYNAAFKKSSGYTDEELKGKAFLDFVHPDDHAMVLEKYQTKYSEEELPLVYEIRGMNKKGESIPLELSVSTYKQKGRVIGIEVIHRDITERKKAEEELRRFSTAVRTSLDGIITGDLNGNITDVNDAVLRMYGDSNKGDLIGKNVLDFVVEGDRTRALRDSMESMKTGQGKTIEYRALTKNGTEIPIEITTAITRDEQGEPIGFVDIVRNMSERKNAELELQMSERKYRELADQLPVIVYEIDSKGKFTFVNEKGFELTGYSHEDIEKGLNILQVVVDEDQGKAKARIQRTLSGEKMDYSEYTLLKKDGSTFPAIACVSAIVREGKTIGLRGTVIDITERKKMEKALLQSQQKFEQLFMSNPEAAVYVDPNERVLNVNPRFTELFGYSADEANGRFLDDFVVPEDRKKEALMLAQKGKEGYVYHETVRKNKKGSLIPVALSSAPIVLQGQHLGDIVLYKDITDRKKAEEERRETMEKVQMMNEKLRVVGGLTRHDVRNKLTAVVGNAYLLKKRVAGDPDATECLNGVEAAVRESERVFDFAGAYEKLGVEQLAYVDAKKIVDEAVGLFPDLRGVKIANDCGGLTLLADSLLGQLFYNLIDDSLKYGEKLTQIRVRYEEFEDKLKLIYEDDGVGIPRDAKSKLFTEGFTTGKGSGYGLYLIGRMMEVYGWTIDETGTHGKGAQFTINIPKAKPDGRPNYKLG